MQGLGSMDKTLRIDVVAFTITGIATQQEGRKLI